MISTIAVTMMLAMADAPPAPAPPPVARMAPPPVPPPPPDFVEGTPPRGNLADFISADDYPPAAVRAREEGRVDIMLLIGPDGRVADCLIDRSSGSFSLDVGTCRVLTARARYEPARDLRGEPITGIIRTHVAWRITSARDQPWGPAVYVQAMRSTPDEAIVCREGWDVDALEDEACRPAEAQWLARKARAAGEVLERSIVTKLTPEGMTEAPDRFSRGAPLWEAEAVFTIGADGRLLECRALRSRYLGSDRPPSDPPGPCAGWGVGKNFYRPAAEATGLRAVNVEVRYYVGRARIR